MCFDYGDYPEFFRAQYVKARKSHRCSGCDKQIHVGELCESYSGKIEGVLDEVLGSDS